MKAAKIVGIICFGAILTVATIAAIRFGDAFSGWGDGTSNNVRRSSAWSAWPTAVFFILSAVGPVLLKTKRIFLFVFSLVVLFGGFHYALGGTDGIFLPTCVSIASLVIWFPLLLSAPPRDPNQSPEATPGPGLS